MTTYDDTIIQIDAAMNSGDVDLAIRLSADLLADTDRQWTEARNANLPTDNALLAGNIAGVRHCEALMAGNHMPEAFSTLLLLLLRTTIDDSHSEALESTLLDLLLLATKTFTNLTQQLNVDDAEATAHASAILTLLGSLLYNQYRQLNTGSSANPNLGEAYSLLSELHAVGAINYPSVIIAGKEVAVDNRGALVGDIIGRAQAMGWFACD